MTEDHRSPRADVVDIGVAVDIGDGGAACRAYKSRCAADAAKGANRRIDTTGDQVLSSREELVGLCLHGAEDTSSEFKLQLVLRGSLG